MYKNDKKKQTHEIFFPSNAFAPGSCNKFNGTTSATVISIQIDIIVLNHLYCFFFSS